MRAAGRARRIFGGAWLRAVRRFGHGYDDLAGSFRSENADLIAAVRAQMDLPAIPARPGSIWAVGLARNEADIIGETVRHLCSQAVDGVIVMDNGSVDSTAEVLRTLSGALPVFVGQDRCSAHLQAIKMMILSDHVTAHGARWVVPFDADEFWFGVEGTLAETLRSSPARVMRSRMLNAFPYGKGGEDWVIDPRQHPMGKVAFRTSTTAVPEAGNHDALRRGLRLGGLGILHLPWRSYDQMRKKVAQGAQSLSQPGVRASEGAHWRHLGSLEEAGLRAQWEGLLEGRPQPELGWYPQGEVRSFTREVPSTWPQIEALVRRAPRSE